MRAFDCQGKRVVINVTSTSKINIGDTPNSPLGDRTSRTLSMKSKYRVADCVVQDHTHERFTLHTAWYIHLV